MYNSTSGQSRTAISNGDGTVTDGSNSCPAGYNGLRTGDFNGAGKADLISYNN